jgi:hypothetical protein
VSFTSSLKLGEIGQCLYYQANAGKIELLDGFKSDFRCMESGRGIELKTDYWAMAKTPNFFFERYSDKDKQSPGGPWQALEQESALYFYVKDLRLFQFDTRELVTELEKITPNLKPYDVKNSTYITQGYRVPREMLKGLYKEISLEVRIKE